MNNDLSAGIKEICRKHGNNRFNLMAILTEVQSAYSQVSGEAMDAISEALTISRVEVESTASFYHFYSDKKKGSIVIRLCDDIIDEMMGSGKVARALESELGISFGQTTDDGRFTLEYTPCIGMCDQAPSALVNDVIVTNLTGDKAREMVKSLKKSPDPSKLVRTFGDGNNSDKLIVSMVSNNIRQRGPVIFDKFESGIALRKAVAMSPVEVIRDIKTSRLRGRGGAGFPTGLKWEFTRQAEGNARYVICNADEGEPGTFKDRVILTECADLMIEGMTIAGYATGAAEGILYLRAEYAYLKNFLENVLEERRKAGLLGKDICGKKGFNFEIRMQMGAGAYVCGEETALISSAEGLRGDPKTRPPFPAQKGYRGCPTSVNNAETFCCAARILDKGPGWFVQMGSHGSAGTKLISICGDCRSPGVYEIAFGTKLNDLLKMAGASDVHAVQIGGPSGRMIGKSDFERTICYDDLSTGGSVMVFDKSRSVIRIVKKFLEFFVDESCGYCTPCRTGNMLLLERISRIVNGLGQASDIPYLEMLCDTIRTTSRCGLGQTSPNPVLSTLKNFRSEYDAAVRTDVTGDLLPSFDIRSALKTSETIIGRPSIHF